jgi:hypothetical protein
MNRINELFQTCLLRIGKGSGNLVPSAIVQICHCLDLCGVGSRRVVGEANSGAESDLNVCEALRICTGRSLFNQQTTPLQCVAFAD